MIQKIAATLLKHAKYAKHDQDGTFGCEARGKHPKSPVLQVSAATAHI